MANYSRETYNRLAQYASVRLQKGVPLVDADWNERDELRRGELRDFLRAFVGDGVPQGNDGFRIAAANAANDFEIRGGDGTAAGAGRCMVDGWEALNVSPVRYSGQRLADQALRAGLAPLPALTTPTAERSDLVYLHVWEREVGATEDRTLVNLAIGVETCVRLKREWAVRVAEGATTLPVPPAGHAFTPLARLNRRAGESTIRPEQIVDLRRVALGILPRPRLDQLTDDLFGQDYRTGGARPLRVSLREAINAVARGDLDERPTGITAGVEQAPILPLASRSDSIRLVRRNENNLPMLADFNPRSGEWRETPLGSPIESELTTVEDAVGNIWLFWLASPSQLVGRSFSAAGAPVGDQISISPDLKASAGFQVRHVAANDGRRGLWVFWTAPAQSGSGASLSGRRYDPDSRRWDERVTTIAEGGQVDASCALLDSTGQLHLFWFAIGSDSVAAIRTRKLSSAGVWEATERQVAPSSSAASMAAIEDGAGRLWLIWSTVPRIVPQVTAVRRGADDTWSPPIQLSTGTLTVQPQAVLRDCLGDVWLFSLASIQGGEAIFAQRYRLQLDSWEAPERLTTPPYWDYRPAVVEHNRAIWLFWMRSQTAVPEQAPEPLALYHRMVLPDL